MSNLTLSIGTENTAEIEETGIPFLIQFKCLKNVLNGAIFVFPDISLRHQFSDHFLPHIPHENVKHNLK